MSKRFLISSTEGIFALLRLRLEVLLVGEESRDSAGVNEADRFVFLQFSLLHHSDKPRHRLGCIDRIKDYGISLRSHPERLERFFGRDTVVASRVLLVDP